MTPNTLTATTIQIGNSTFPFTGLAEASRAYSEAINATGATCSGRTGPMAPRCLIKNNDTVVAHVSYNGKVWLGDDWDESTPCLFDPSVTDLVSPSSQRRIRRLYEEWVGYDPKEDDPLDWDPIESLETLREIRELRKGTDR